MCKSCMSMCLCFLFFSFPLKAAFTCLLLQAKMSQPKDDAGSECAKNGYAGTSLFMCIKSAYSFIEHANCHAN